MERGLRRPQPHPRHPERSEGSAFAGEPRTRLRVRSESPVRQRGASRSRHTANSEPRQSWSGVSNVRITPCHPERSEGSAFAGEPRTRLRVRSESPVRQRGASRSCHTANSEPRQSWSGVSNVRITPRHPERSEGSAFAGEPRARLRVRSESPVRQRGLSRSCHTAIPRRQSWSGVSNVRITPRHPERSEGSAFAGEPRARLRVRSESPVRQRGASRNCHTANSEPRQSWSGVSDRNPTRVILSAAKDLLCR